MLELRVVIAQLGQDRPSGVCLQEVRDDAPSGAEACSSLAWAM